MPSLAKREDVQKTVEHGSNRFGNVLKVKTGKTPLFFLSLDYTEGFVHWVTLPNGSREKVVCAGGPEAKGRAPDKCPLCAYVDGLFKRAEAMNWISAGLLEPLQSHF